LIPKELKRLMTVVANPRQFKVSHWFLNRKKDYKVGWFSQVATDTLGVKLRDDLERLKKIRVDWISAPTNRPTSGRTAGGPTACPPVPRSGPTDRPSNPPSEAQLGDPRRRSQDRPNSLRSRSRRPERPTSNLKVGG
ncbi:hypothetical protein BAE44_0026100, partial [Dichanthelium oligosanthes]